MFLSISAISFSSPFRISYQNLSFLCQQFPTAEPSSAPSIAYEAEYTGATSELTEAGTCPAGGALLCNPSGGEPDYQNGKMQVATNAISICEKQGTNPDGSLILENICMVNAPGQIVSLQDDFDVCGCCTGYTVDPKYKAGDPSRCTYKTCCIPV
jgi:hypothetical protein